MYVFECFLEVEGFVDLFWCYADVSSRCETPVVFLDLLAVDELHEPWHIDEDGVWKPFHQPYSVAMEVAHLTELFDRDTPCVLTCLACARNVPSVPGITFSGVKFFLAHVEEPPEELEYVVHLL